MKMLSNLKTSHVLTFLLFIVFLGVQVAGAAEPEGNPRKGKYTYRGIYKDCHARGAVESNKPAIDPDSKTRRQWIRTFEKEKFDEFGCAEEWATLPENDKADILAYLWKYAADSPTPAKCK